MRQARWPMQNAPILLIAAECAKLAGLGKLCHACWRGCCVRMPGVLAWLLVQVVEHSWWCSTATQSSEAWMLTQAALLLTQARPPQMMRRGRSTTSVAVQCLSLQHKTDSSGCRRAAKSCSSTPGALLASHSSKRTPWEPSVAVPSMLAAMTCISSNAYICQSMGTGQLHACRTARHTGGSAV